MIWYEASEKKIKFGRDDLVRDGFGAGSPVTLIRVAENLRAFTVKSLDLHAGVHRTAN